MLLTSRNFYWCNILAFGARVGSRGLRRGQVASRGGRARILGYFVAIFLFYFFLSFYYRLKSNLDRGNIDPTPKMMVLTRQFGYKCIVCNNMPLS